MTLARKGHWPEAMAHYDQAIELRPDFGEAHRNRALGWLAHGDFERGWPEAEWRLKCRNPPGFRVSLPRWTGENLGGKTDPAPLGTGPGRHASVHSLRPPGRRARRRGSGSSASRLSPDWSLAAKESIVSSTARRPLRPIDVHAPLMSVPAILGTTLATLPQAPYLSADAATIEHWRRLARCGRSDVSRSGIGLQDRHRLARESSEPNRSLAILPARTAGARSPRFRACA